MIAWRLAKREAIEAAFSGDGARLYGGRWNPVGTPVVYAATQVALAALELLGHIEPEEAAPHFSFRVNIPDELVETLDVGTLPGGWDHPEPQEATAAIGAEWASSGRSLALLVPSVHVPPGTGSELERNVLLNPRHPAFQKLVIEPGRPYSFDSRILPGRAPRSSPARPRRRRQ